MGEIPESRIPDLLRLIEDWYSTDTVRTCENCKHWQEQYAVELPAMDYSRLCYDYLVQDRKDRVAPCQLCADLDEDNRGMYPMRASWGNCIHGNDYWEPNERGVKAAMPDIEFAREEHPEWFE